MLNQLLSILFPLRCLGCQRYDYWICPICVSSWPKLDGALGLYQQPTLKQAIHLMKYQGYKGIAVELGRYLADHIPADSYDLVIPVPMHWRRRWQRGYNQALILAQQFPKPVWPALRKAKATRNQATLNRAERQLNLAAAFTIIPTLRSGLQGQRVLLVDDVYSTGSTTASCTQQLLEGGVAEVRVVVVALNLKNTPTV